MLHATESNLRRLEDEPLAIPDRVVEHVERCRHCRDRLALVARDADRCARLVAGPQPVADLDVAWARLQQDLRRPGARRSGRASDAAAVPRRPFRYARISLRSGLVAGAAAVVLAGTAAAATLTTVFAPTRVAPVSLSTSDVSALADFMGLGPHLTAGRGGGQNVIGGFSTSEGSRTTSFGTIRWSSSGTAHVVPTLADAVGEAGFPVVLPSEVPRGVGEAQQFVVQPRVQVTVTFDPGVANVGGSSVVLDAGPAVLVAYGSSGGLGVPTLGIMTMPRPVAASSGATMGQIEAFLLGQSGLPADLVEEIRLLGDLGTTLPVPVPAGAVERSVEVGSSPGVLVADSSGTASGVVWEDGAGVLHAVAGLVDQQDVLDVADQLG